MRDAIVWAGLGVLALLCLLLALALVRTRSHTRRDLAAAHAETAELRTQIEQIERVLTAPVRRTSPTVAEYTITHLGETADEARRGSVEGSSGGTPPVDRALFADLVLRETVVRAASLAHGVRRALAGETRNRVRYEVKREIKRARKQRRADTREARREWEARQRAEVDDPSSENETAA